MATNPKTTLLVETKASAVAPMMPHNKDGTELPKLYGYITGQLLPDLLPSESSAKKYQQKLEAIKQQAASNPKVFREGLYQTLEALQADIKEAKLRKAPPEVIKGIEQQRSALALLIKELYPNPRTQLQDSFPWLRFILRAPKEKGEWVMPTKLFQDSPSPNEGGALYLGSRPFEGDCLDKFVAEHPNKEILIVSCLSFEEAFDDGTGEPITFQGNKMVTPESVLPPNVERLAYTYNDHSALIQPHTGKPIPPEALYERIKTIYDAIKAGKVVYVHCWSGIERSTIHSILTQCALEGQTLLEASTAIHDKRDITKRFETYHKESQQLLINSFFYLLAQNPNKNLESFKGKSPGEIATHLQLFFELNELDSPQAIKEFASAHPAIQQCVKNIIASLSPQQLKAIQQSNPQLIEMIKTTQMANIPEIKMEAAQQPEKKASFREIISSWFKTIASYVSFASQTVKTAALTGTVTATIVPAGTHTPLTTLSAGIGMAVIAATLSSIFNAKHKSEVKPPQSEAKSPQPAVKSQPTTTAANLTKIGLHRQHTLPAAPTTEEAPQTRSMAPPTT